MPFQGATPTQGGGKLGGFGVRRVAIRPLVLELRPCHGGEAECQDGLIITVTEIGNSGVVCPVLPQ